MAPHQYANQLSATPEGVLTTACAFMRISAGLRGQPQYALVFAGEHQAVMAQAGWSKDDVRQFCFEHTKTSQAEMKRINVMPGAVQPEDETDHATRWWRRRKILSSSPLVAVQACSRPIFPAGVASAAHRASRKRSAGHRGRWCMRRRRSTMALQVFDPTTEAKEQPMPSCPGQNRCATCVLVWSRIRSTTRISCCSGLPLFWRRSTVPRAILYGSKHGSGVPAHKEIIDEIHRRLRCRHRRGRRLRLVQLGQCARRYSV